MALVAAVARFGGRPRGFRATRGKQSRSGCPPIIATAAVGPLLRAAALRGSLSAPIYRCFRSRVRALAACIPLEKVSAFFCIFHFALDAARKAGRRASEMQKKSPRLKKLQKKKL